MESVISNARDGIGDFYGGQACANTESVISNARDGIGDFYGGQARATTESVISNARNRVSRTTRNYRVGNRYAARII